MQMSTGLRANRLHSAVVVYHARVFLVGIGLAPYPGILLDDLLPSRTKTDLRTGTLTTA
jgi:hypothetical protein